MMSVPEPYAAFSQVPCEVAKGPNGDVTHVFGDRTVEVSVEAAGGFRAKVQGRRPSTRSRRVLMNPHS
jgi:hypothetical protein